jgi:hypothetical protein
MWKKSEPESIKLPSGNVAMLQRVNMYVLTKTGQLPSEMMRMLEGDEDMTFEERQRAVEFQVASAFVEPKVVVGEAGEGEISIDEVEDRDKSEVLNWVSGID